jgi:hypothetical protein
VSVKAGSTSWRILLPFSFHRFSLSNVHTKKTIIEQPARSHAATAERTVPFVDHFTLQIAEILSPFHFSGPSFISFR